MNLDMLAAVVDERGEEQLRPVLDPAPGRCCVVLRPVDRTPMSPAG
jgi:hypothetical protein